MDGAGLNCLQKATDNGAWLTDIPHCLNGTELSWEEFQDNLLLQYGIVSLNLPTECDVRGKKLLVPHALSRPKGGLVLARHNDAAKEWVDASAREINPSAKSYEPKINSRTVKEERNGAGGQATVPDESRVDVFVHGFWKWGTTALFDMRKVNLDAGSYLCQMYAKAL